MKMDQPSLISQMAKGLWGAGTALFQNIFSFQTVNGLWYSFCRYPFSPAFKKLTAPRDGAVLEGGICIVFSADYCVPLYGLEGFMPFDVHRAAKIYSALIADHTISPDHVFIPGPVSADALLQVHDADYISGFPDPAHTADALEFALIQILPAFIVKRIVNAYKVVTGGTVLAAELALDHGLAVNLGGGFHHARPYRGAGFCPFADIPIAAKKIRKNKKRLKILVVDLDVHQGDGIIACMGGHDHTFIFSIHQSEIYPHPKETGDLDVEIHSGTDDDVYLSLLGKNLPLALDQSRPDLVFYIAGADILKEDPLASVEVSAVGLIQRDQMVVTACRKKGIPLVMTLGGGYSPLAWQAQYQSIRHIIREDGA